MENSRNDPVVTAVKRKLAELRQYDEAEVFDVRVWTPESGWSRPVCVRAPGAAAADLDAHTPEQRARDMLERMGVEDAQSFSAGSVVELANLIAENDALKRLP